MMVGHSTAQEGKCLLLADLCRRFMQGIKLANNKMDGQLDYDLVLVLAAHLQQLQLILAST